MNPVKISTMMFTWNGVGDRFLSKYFEPQTIDQIFPKLQGSVINGVELQHPRHVNRDNVEQVKTLLAQYNLTPVIVNIPMASDIKWKMGAFSNPSEEIREMAVERVKEALNVCRMLGVDQASIFLGQDGYDYPFVTDYRRDWDNIIDCFTKCAEFAPDIKICIEYKPREPRTHKYLMSASKTLLLINEIGKKNIGLLADIGHAWMAGENYAETIVMAARKECLFHVHMNDNFGVTDDDLGVGGIRMAEYMEALYWMNEVRYDGWLSLDVHSPREVSDQIIIESANFLYNLNMLLEKIGKEKLKKLVLSCDGTQLIRLINEELIKKAL
ncbi:MAG TPA: sugar phosphate isomerase/epimerase family protein [Clostridia bacterium]